MKISKPSKKKGRKKGCGRVDPYYKPDLNIRGAER
jgi:hypothetical protein